jgi:uncharacterized membrane protein required for colicin V production
MLDKTLIAVIGLDIFVVVILILYGFTGFRRGGIKSFLSLLFLYIAFIVAMILFEKPAIYLQVTLDTKSSTARMVCFASIFAVLVVLTRYLYHISTKVFIKHVLVRSISSGVIGAILGVMEGFLLIGIIYMNIAFYPVNPPLSNTISFKVMKDIPIDLRDSSLWFLPSMRDSLAQKESALKEKVKQKQDSIKDYKNPSLNQK